MQRGGGKCAEPLNFFVGALKVELMRDLRRRLADALSASGYSVKPDENRLAPLAEKLDFLLKTNRYSRLISGLLDANNGANLRSLVLEVTFAFRLAGIAGHGAGRRSVNTGVGRLASVAARSRASRGTRGDRIARNPARLYAQRRRKTIHFLPQRGGRIQRGERQQMQNAK